MKLDIQVGLNPGHIVLDADPAPTPQRGTAPSPQFLADISCGQTAGWIKMPLSTKVGLGPGHTMLHGTQFLPPKRVTAINFRPMSIVAKRSPISATAEHLFYVCIRCAVTEYEIERGMLSCPATCNASSLCFMRSISGLTDNLSNAKARMYVDIVPDKTRSSSSSSSELDVEAQALLEELRQKVTGCVTDERNLEHFEVDWRKDERRNPSDNPHYLSAYDAYTTNAKLVKLKP